MASPFRVVFPEHVINTEVPGGHIQFGSMSPTSVIDATLVFDSDNVSTTAPEVSSAQNELLSTTFPDPDCLATDLDADDLNNDPGCLAASLEIDDYTDCLSDEEDMTALPSDLVAHPPELDVDPIYNQQSLGLLSSAVTFQQAVKRSFDQMEHKIAPSTLLLRMTSTPTS